MRSFDWSSLPYRKLFLVVLLLAAMAWLIVSGNIGNSNSPDLPVGLFMVTSMLVIGVIGNQVERFGIPQAIGQMLAGFLLLSVGLSSVSTGAYDWFMHNHYVHGFAEWGIVLVMFWVGLESNLEDLNRVKKPSLSVASVGVAMPFIFGLGVGATFFSGESFIDWYFFAAALTATSVTISSETMAAVGLSMHKVKFVVLGAAVADDITGVFSLSVGNSLAEAGVIQMEVVLIMLLKAVVFLVGGIFLGRLIAKPLNQFLSRHMRGWLAMMAVSLLFGFGFAALSWVMGLGMVIGAFVGGMILDPIHLSYYMDEADRPHYDAELQEVIEQFKQVFGLVFFVYVGAQIRAESLLKIDLYLVMLVTIAIAFIGKALAGLAYTDGTRLERMVVGLAMVPRGEVGLIFAAEGLKHNALTNDMFSVIMVMVLATSLIGPIMLGRYAPRIGALK